MSMKYNENSFCSSQPISVRFPKRSNAAFGKADFVFQKGFTLLEMLVVSLILLVIAGGVVTSFRDVGSDAAEQAARFQMQQLGEAIEAYYKDNGTFPSRDTPADLSFLFDKPAPAAEWDVDYRLGWRGPYLNGRKFLYLDIGDDLQPDGTSIDDGSVAGEPYIISGGGSEVESVIAIADPFDHYPVVEGQSLSSNGCSGATPCLLEWRQASGATDTLDRFGRPYLALDLEVLADNSIIPGAARLVSMGVNGIYEPNSCDYSEADDTDPDFCSNDLLCTSSGDDIVLCLR